MHTQTYDDAGRLTCDECEALIDRLGITSHVYEWFTTVELNRLRFQRWLWADKAKEER